MPDHQHPVPVARRRVGALVASLLVGWGLLSTGPAAAHDQLVGTEPADGVVLDQAPGTVVLTFNADQLPVGAAVVVRDAAGTDRADGAPVVDGRTVTQALRGGSPAGVHTVQWRSVSGDGHPIEGSFAFEVTSGPGPVDPPQEDQVPAEAAGDDGRQAAAGTAVEGAAPAEDAGGSTTDDATDDAAAGGDPMAVDDGADGGLVALGVGLAVAAAAAVVVVRRARAGAGEEAA